MAEPVFFVHHCALSVCNPRTVPAGKKVAEPGNFPTRQLMNLSSKRVALRHCPDYGPAGLAAGLDQLVDTCLAGIGFSSTHVLLKPNLISSRQGPLACTEAAFILAAARCFLDRGARVSLGDSPAFGTATGVLKKLGLLGQLRKLSVRVTDFKKVRKLVLPSGVSAGLAAEALDCDLLINLPRVKAHTQLRVTLAVKNCFGCLAGMRKAWWHMEHGGSPGLFESLLVELLAVLPDGITLVDGITAMHETGPLNGKPCQLGVLAGSTNPVAVDRALLAIIGLEPEASPLWQACDNAGLAGTRLAELDFPLLAPGDFPVTNFQVPRELTPIRFNPFRFVRSSIRRVLHGLS